MTREEKKTIKIFEDQIVQLKIEIEKLESNKQDILSAIACEEIREKGATEYEIIVANYLHKFFCIICNNPHSPFACLWCCELDNYGGRELWEQNTHKTYLEKARNLLQDIAEDGEEGDSGLSLLYCLSMIDQARG